MCVDARSCEVREDACLGAYADAVGLCFAPDGGPYPRVCCRLSGHRLQHGVIEPLCAPAGPGMRLRFGLGQLACGADSTISMQIDLLGEGPMAGQQVFSGAEVVAQVCSGDACTVAHRAELGLYPVGDYELNGYFWLYMRGGEEIAAGFTAETCPDQPVECE